MRGFDAERYPWPSVEDIDLGYRLRERGGRIFLDRNMLSKHLKRWGVVELVRVDIFRRAKYFGINVLGAGQQEVSDRFARQGQDRFGGLAWEAGESGVPLLPGAIAQIELAVHRVFSAGDHDIFVGEMLRGRVAEGDPLIYFASRYRRLAE